MLDPCGSPNFVDTAKGPMYSRGRALTLRQRYLAPLFSPQGGAP